MNKKLKSMKMTYADTIPEVKERQKMKYKDVALVVGYILLVFIVAYISALKSGYIYSGNLDWNILKNQFALDKFLIIFGGLFVIVTGGILIEISKKIFKKK